MLQALLVAFAGTDGSLAAGSVALGRASVAYASRPERTAPAAAREGVRR